MVAEHRSSNSVSHFHGLAQHTLGIALPRNPLVAPRFRAVRPPNMQGAGFEMQGVDRGVVV